jgi:hypothetical protein
MLRSQESFPVTLPHIPGGTMNTPNFTTTNCGSTTGTAQGDAPLGSQIAINGSTDLSQCIVGIGGAYVQQIIFQHHTNIGVRPAEITVYGVGPEHGTSGSLDLRFTGSDNQDHTLSISSDTPQWHTDAFESQADIISVQWSPG